MNIFNHIDDCRNLKNPILTLGMFDGIHIGHQAIIKQLNEIALREQGESVLLTFEPHPRVVLQKGADDLQLLTTLDEKIELLEKSGLENLILHPFDQVFANLSAEEFVKELLVDKVQIHTIVIGYDHHFGKNRQGNFEQLNEFSEKFGFNCIKIKEIKSNGNHISSTQIRNALIEGNIDFAQQGLGRNYSLTGKVIHGDKLGRKLGFPTANLETEKFKLIPGNGVYIVKSFLKDEVFKGLLSIGTRPTITNSKEKRAEVYLMDFDREIYGETLKVEMLHKIRDDQKFDSLDDLVNQMNLDKKFAAQYPI